MLLYTIPQCSALLPCAFTPFLLFFFLTLQPALAALLQEFCSQRCTLLPFFPLAGDTVPCPHQKVQSMMLNLYVKGKFWILHGTPTAALCCSLRHGEKPPASHSRLPVWPGSLGRRRRYRKGSLGNPPAHFKSLLMLWYVRVLLCFFFSFFITNTEKDSGGITSSSDCLSRWGLCFLVRPSGCINPALAVLRIIRYFQI